MSTKNNYSEVPSPPRVATASIAIVIMIGCFVAAIAKFVELVMMIRSEKGSIYEGAFAISPVINYTLASIGFLFLFFWATSGGMFRDVERPKIRMLELEDMLEERSNAPK